MVTEEEKNKEEEMNLAETAKFEKQYSGTKNKKETIAERAEKAKEKKELKELNKKFYLGEKGAAAVDAFSKRTNVKRIDPLKGLIEKPKKTGKRGRPRKYAPMPQTNRPIGRPRDVRFSLSGRPIVSNERMMGQIPQRGKVQQQREPFIAPTPSQRMMNEILGQSNQTWGFGGNPIRINGALRTGGGITRNDEGHTSSFFGGWRK